MGVLDEELEDAPLTSRQRQRLAVDFDIAAVEEHLQPAAVGLTAHFVDAPPDRVAASHDLPHMNRFAHDVVDAGREQLQRRIERADLGERHDRRPGAVANHLGISRTLLELAEQECLHRVDIGRRHGREPFAELARLKAERRYALTCKRGRVGVGNLRPPIDNDVHARPPCPNHRGSARGLRLRDPKPPGCTCDIY